MTGLFSHKILCNYTNFCKHSRPLLTTRKTADLKAILHWLDFPLLAATSDCTKYTELLV